MPITKEYITFNIEDIIPYENNPRINDDAVAGVVESIKQCGELDPIEVDENNVILSGHTRLKAYKELGYDSISVLRITGLTEPQKRKYRLLTNKAGEVAGWDFDKLELELEGLDFDGFDFGFDVDSPILEEDAQKEVVEDDYDEEQQEDQEQERERDGYFGDERERTFKSANFDRYDESRTAGFYQMPIIKAWDYVPTDLIGFNYVKSTDKTDCGVHFFIDDYQFERVWNSPDENIERLRKFQCVLTPDWSLYMDMPMALKVWNVYRQRLIGQIFQDSGLIVIPTLSWAEPETYNFCFDGIEQGGTVAVSTVGVMKSESARAIWADGMSEAMKRLRPKNVICYGSKIDFDFGNASAIYFKARQFGEGRNK